jgi:hypothetical protein
VTDPDLNDTAPRGAELTDYDRHNIKTYLRLPQPPAPTGARRPGRCSVWTSPPILIAPIASTTAT